MSEVVAISWDITLGAATSGLGQLILGYTSDSSDAIPEAVDHVGLKVFGYLYEYGDLGILKSELPAEDGKLTSKYPAFKLREVESLGETTVTSEEFQAWVDEKNATDFKGSCYNVVTNSCVVWAKQATEFLQVPHPPNWDKIIQWAERNKRFTSIVGITGMGSRQVQHKATEYVQDPSKIKAKAKRLYRKIRRKKRHAKAQPGSESTGETAPNTEDINGNEQVCGDEDNGEIDCSGSSGDDQDLSDSGSENEEEDVKNEEAVEITAL